MAFLDLSTIVKSYQRGGEKLVILNGVDLNAELGDALSITGPSGSGKSTLLHLIGTLDQPDDGVIKVDGQDPFAMKEASLAKFRNDYIGFVFQDHHLLPQYRVLENVLLPSLAFKRPNQEARARQLLERVGLGERLDHLPSELSGGERQRTAIARALINSPKVLLCDEPTGNLDQRTAQSVTDLLFELHEQGEFVLMIVTHSPELAARCPRQYALRDGGLVAVHDGR